MSLRNAVTKFWADWPLMGAVGISVVAFALRVAPLSESLWLDELHTAWCAVGPLDEVARRAAMGNQSPIFYWLEWLLVGLLGESEISLRLPSLVAGSLLPMAVFLLARRWKAEVAGLVAAGLAAVDSQSIFFATEARPYALLQLLAVVHVGLLAEIVARPTIALRAAWVVMGALLFHLHYTAALLLVAEVLFVVGFSAVERVPLPYSWGRAVLDQAVLGLLCLPAAMSVLHIFAKRANWAVFIEQRPLTFAINWMPLPGFWWLMLVIMAATGWQISRNQKFPLIQTRLVVLCFLWLFVPIFVAWMTTQSDVARLFFARYVATTFPAAMLVAGLCVQLIHLRSMRLVMGVATVGAAIWFSGIIPQIQADERVIADRNEDWRGCVAWLNERIGAEGFPVFVESGYIEADELLQPHDALLDQYCLSPVNSLYPLDASVDDVFALPLKEPGRLPQAGEMLAVHRGGCWVVVRGKKERGRAVAAQVSQTLRGSDANANWKTDVEQSFGRVQVLRVVDSARR